MKWSLSICSARYLTTALIFAALATACTTTTTQSFNVNKNAKVEASLIAVDADFSRFDRILARDMGIFFPTDAAPSVGDQERTRQIFARPSSASFAPIESCGSMNQAHSKYKRRWLIFATQIPMLCPVFAMNSEILRSRVQSCS